MSSNISLCSINSLLFCYCYKYLSPDAFHWEEVYLIGVMVFSNFSFLRPELNNVTSFWACFSGHLHEELPEEKNSSPLLSNTFQYIMEIKKPMDTIGPMSLKSLLEGCLWVHLSCCGCYSSYHPLPISKLQYEWKTTDFQVILQFFC